MYTTSTPRRRGQALPSRESLPHGHNGGPDGAAMARDSTPHGGRPLKDACHHASSRLWWPARRRGLSVGLCRTIASGPHEAAAEEIEMRAAEHLALQHSEAADMALDRPGGTGQAQALLDPCLVVVEPRRIA